MVALAIDLVWVARCVWRLLLIAVSFVRDPTISTTPPEKYMLAHIQPIPCSSS